MCCAALTVVRNMLPGRTGARVVYRQGILNRLGNAHRFRRSPPRRSLANLEHTTGVSPDKHVSGVYCNVIGLFRRRAGQTRG